MNVFIYISKIFFRNVKLFIKQLLKISQFCRQKKIILEYNGKFNRFTIKNDYPCLLDDTIVTSFDAHYLYHVAWACREIVKQNPIKHVDISSSLNFCSTISAFVPTEFYDFRPAKINLSNLTCGEADLLSLPFLDNSIDSLSCMHVVEHVGLGRYGDALDYDGDIKAVKELKRVLAIGGLLYFVVPICFQSEIEFNAHRKYSFHQIKQIFCDFILVQHSLIEDNGNFIDNPVEYDYDRQNYGCGCFIFKKIV